MGQLIAAPGVVIQVENSLSNVAERDGERGQDGWGRERERECEMKHGDINRTAKKKTPGVTVKPT